MKAVQLTQHGRPGTFVHGEVPDPDLCAGDVLARVRACGLNRLDLWHEEGELPLPLELPRIPGCEISGEVLAVAEGVTDWQPGDRVAVQSNLFCGECEFCERGEESICLNGELLGVQRDGGFAENVAVPARSLVRLPDGVGFIESAAVTLAGSTAMHMLTDRARVREGDWVLAMAGNSGVGSAAIQIAKSLGARVISSGSTEEKRQLAITLGAEVVVDHSDPDWPREVRKATGKCGVDIVVEHIGGDVLAGAFRCLARGGRIVTCGATAGQQVALDLWPLFVKQQQLIGSYGRNRLDMDRTLRFVRDGKLKPVIDEVLPLAETARAFQRLRKREVKGKLVIRVD